MTQRNYLFRVLIGLVLLFLLPLFIWAVLTQRIELRKRAASAEPVICWTRVYEQNNTPYWPNSCAGGADPNSGVCAPVVRQLSITEMPGYAKWKAEGRKAIYGCTAPINWQTQYARLQASSIFIVSNGTSFTANGATDLALHSNPPDADPNYMTLEATWTQNGFNMGMNIYFAAETATPSAGSKVGPPREWRVTEIRTSDSQSGSDWIYYKNPGIPPVNIGSAFTTAGLSMTSTDGGTGEIRFTDLRLQAFLNETPAKPGCYYQQVECVKAPCNPVLVCPSPAPGTTTCTGSNDGASCSTCVSSLPKPSGAGVDSCRLTPGTCQQGACVLNPSQCTPLPTCYSQGTVGPDGLRSYCDFQRAPNVTYCPPTVPTPTPIACLDVAQTLASVAPLKVGSSVSLNWGGLNEKWFQDKNSQWYYIFTPTEWLIWASQNGISNAKSQTSTYAVMKWNSETGLKINSGATGSDTRVTMTTKSCYDAIVPSYVFPSTAHNWCPGPNGSTCQYDGCNTCTENGACTASKACMKTGICTNNLCQSAPIPSPTPHNWCAGPDGSKCQYDCNTCNGRGGCTKMGCPNQTGTCTNNLCQLPPTPTPTPHNWCTGPDGTSCTYTACTPCNGASCSNAWCPATPGTCSNNQCQPLAPTPTPTPACVRNNPTITINPSNQSGHPGDNLFYKILFTDTDSVACAPAQFSITAQPGTGLTSLLTNTTISNVYPQNTPGDDMNVTSATLGFSSPTTVPIIVTVTNNSSGLYTQLNTTSYTVVPTPTPTPTPTPSPTPTPTVTPTPTNSPTPTPTPTPMPQNLEFLVKLAGVTGGQAEGAKITVKFNVQGGSTLQLSSPLTLSHIGNGVYKTTATITNPFPAGTNYTISIKGEKHAAIVFTHQSSQANECSDGQYITMPNPVPSGLTFDFTGVPLPAGDTNPQDNQVNQTDIDRIVALMGKSTANLTDNDKLVGDLNYDGVININDLFLMYKTLQTRCDAN